MAKKVNPALGSTLDSFLADQGMLDEVQSLAAKSVLVWQIKTAMEEQNLSKTKLAERMQTSRSAVNRLLDPQSPSLNLTTMEKAACALGKKLEVKLV